MLGKIFGALVGVVILACIVYIIYDCIHDKSPKKKAIIIICIVGILCVYAVIIYLIRVNPILVQYRKRFGGSIFWLIFVVVFMGGLTIGGALQSKTENPKTKRERLGNALIAIAWYSRLILLALLPIIIAFEID